MIFMVHRVRWKPHEIKCDHFPDHKSGFWDYPPAIEYIESVKTEN